MPPLDLNPELNSDVVKICNYLVRLLRNPNHTYYIENSPSAYHEALAAAQEVLVAVQDIPYPKPLPTPAPTPVSHQDAPQIEDSGGSGSGANEHENDVDPDDRGLLAVHEHKILCVDSPDQISTTIQHKNEYLFVDPHADQFEAEQTNDDTQRLAKLNVRPLSDRNNDNTYEDEPPLQPTVTSATSHKLDLTQNTSFKRKTESKDGRVSKRAHIELADATDGDLWSSRARYLTIWTYEEFALRYYMLLPSSLRTSEIRDLASKLLTNVLGASKSKGLDKYQLGLTEISFGADTLAILENLRLTCLDHYATVIQKNLRAKHCRSKYLEVRNATLLIQSGIRRHLAWKHAEKTRKIKAAITFQNVWRGQKQRNSLNVLRNNVVFIQAAAKGFLRRREIINTRFRKAAVFIQRAWRLRQHRRKVVVIQSLWRGKCARRVWEKVRREMGSLNAVGQGDHRNERMAKLPIEWQTQLQLIKSTEVLKDCQHFCYTIRNPVTSIDVRPDQDALKQSGGPGKVPSTDRRLKQLKFILEDGWEKEQSFETPKIVLQVSRRLHLAELVSMYEAEKTMPQKRGQPSVREKFVNIFFPHTVKDKNQKPHERKKGEKINRRKEGKKMSKRKGKQLSELEVRQQAEGAFDYWIRLGKPLWILSQHYGPPILAVLPKEVTEKNLCALLPKKGHYQDVVDYVELYHPGIKKQISNLSFLLPGVDAGKLPSKRLLIETIPHHQLSDHSFEELFQFSDDGESSKLGGIPSEGLSQSSQMPMHAIDDRQVDAAVDPSSNQKQANNSWEELNFDHYYIQGEDDWRVEQPSDENGEFDGNSPQLDQEYVDMDAYINYPPTNTLSITSSSAAVP